MPTFFNDDGEEPVIGPPGRRFSFNGSEGIVVVGCNPRSKGSRANKVYPSEPAATDKQVKFAKWISDTLNINLPEKKTKKAYSEFIGKNIPKFEEELALRKDLECECTDYHEWCPEQEY